MTRRIFAELKQRTEVRPIFWNGIGRCYQELGRNEHRLLVQPFRSGQRPVSRPEWYGQNPFVTLWRLILRRRLNMDRAIGAEDVFLVPDIYRDTRGTFLPGFIGRTPARACAIFHDAADLRLRPLHPANKVKVRRYIESLARFDLVICISDEARRDLQSLWKDFGCSPAQTTVESWPGERATMTDPAGNGAENIILYVSSFAARKNHLALLSAAEKLWSRGLSFELHLIGRSAGPPMNKVVPEIRRLRRRGRPLHWYRHVDDDRLYSAYRCCRFTVYPSLMEGFGLPIMESLLHGKPCICGGNGALGEIAQGGGCLIVDQTSEDALADAMAKLLIDAETYVRLSREARERNFRSWPDYIHSLLGHLGLSGAKTARGVNVPV